MAGYVRSIVADDLLLRAWMEVEQCRRRGQRCGVQHVADPSGIVEAGACLFLHNSHLYI
jgi:hypothetical protein